MYDDFLSRLRPGKAGTRTGRFLSAKEDVMTKDGWRGIEILGSLTAAMGFGLLVMFDGQLAGLLPFGIGSVTAFVSGVKLRNIELRERGRGQDSGRAS